jgi:uncharacterized protein (TIGR04255 family)
MHFPISERVIYTPNPLAEVICQVRFPRILKIDLTLPSAFQERVKSRYPVLTESGPIAAPGPLSPEVASALGFDPALLGMQRAFDLASEDGRWRLSLTSQFVALTTVHYERWEIFKEHLLFSLDAFIAEYTPPYFSRVGLRYRDLIRRSALKLGDAKWHTLLRPHILGELSNPEVEDSADEAARQLVLRLDSPDAARVRLYHGFVKYSDQAETCYLIDADFFTESRMESRHVGDTEPTLDQFNREAGRLFRWCISDRLHTALGPIAV